MMNKNRNGGHNMNVTETLVYDGWLFCYVRGGSLKCDPFVEVYNFVFVNMKYLATAVEVFDETAIIKVDDCQFFW